jgi:hypothetical protein
LYQYRITQKGTVALHHCKNFVKGVLFPIIIQEIGPHLNHKLNKVEHEDTWVIGDNPIVDMIIVDTSNYHWNLILLENFLIYEVIGAGIIDTQLMGRYCWE